VYKLRRNVHACRKNPENPENFLNFLNFLDFRMRLWASIVSSRSKTVQTPPGDFEFIIGAGPSSKIMGIARAVFSENRDFWKRNGFQKFRKSRNFLNFWIF